MSEVSTIYRRLQERMQLELRDLSRLTRFASPRTRWVGNQRGLALCRSVSNCVCMYLHVFAVSVQYISRILTSFCPWIYLAKIGLWQAAAQRIGSKPLRFNENSWSHLRLPRSPVCWHNFVLAMAILCMWKVGHMSCRSAPCRAWQNSKRLCSSCSIWLSSDPRTVHFVSICTIVRISWNVVGLRNMDAVSLPRHHFGKSKQFLHVRTFMATDSLGDSKIQHRGFARPNLSRMKWLQCISFQVCSENPGGGALLCSATRWWPTSLWSCRGRLRARCCIFLND